MLARMRHSTDRILTTHAGALPKPDYLADDPSQLPQATREIVDNQLASGLDVINDGELGKSNFYMYALDRLTGFERRELRPGEEHPLWGVVRREEQSVGDYFRRQGSPFVFPGRRDRTNLSIVGVCTGPIRYSGQSAVDGEIANFKAALRGKPYLEAYLPAPSPGILASSIINEHYPDLESYIFAIADALHAEYQAITNAGFILQVDSPDTADDWQRHTEMDVAAYRRHTELGIEAINRALRGIPASQVRYHVCWASWHGPHVADLPLSEFLDIVLGVNAEAISIEAANPRHQHEWTVWQTIKLPPGKVFVPGVVGHYSDFIEHPELIANRLVQFADVVGRENVIAGTDCGLSRVGHPWVAWAKFQAMAEGARIASQRLWT